MKKGPLVNLSGRKGTLSGLHIPVPTFPLSTPRCFPQNAKSLYFNKYINELKQKTGQIQRRTARTVSNDYDWRQSMWLIQKPWMEAKSTDLASSTKPYEASSTKPYGASPTQPYGASSTKPYGASSTKPYGASCYTGSKTTFSLLKDILVAQSQTSTLNTKPILSTNLSLDQSGADKGNKWIKTDQRNSYPITKWTRETS